MSRIKYLLFVILTTPLFSQNHFTPVWSGSPYQAMNIFLESATYAGSPLSSGDEIGVYDGVLCVGAVRLSGAVSPYLEIKTSTDNPLTTPIDGFTSGHTITYKLWRSSSSTEVNNVTVTYNPASPIPTFTPLGTAFVNLLFSIVPPNIVITPPTLPGGMKNRLYSQAFSAAGGISPYIWSLEQGQLPSGLSLSTSGTLSGTPTVTGSYNFTIKAQDVASNYGTRQYTLVIADPLLISTSSPLPGGKVGTPYSVGLIASGGTPPYAWGLTDGTLPQGLTLSSGGVLSGRPIQATSSSFTISVTDKASFTTPKSFTLEVTDSLSITTASPLPEAQAKIQYSYRLNASGGKPPYVWSADRASMPDGFTLSSEGTLSGTNNYGGAFGPIVKVTDAQSDSVKKMFEFRINPAPLIFTSPSRLPDGMVNEPYAGGWSVSGGIGQFSWSIDSGAIPTGLQLSYRGFLFGTPRDTGTFIFKVTVRCSWDMSASQTDTLKIKKMHIAMAFPLPPSRVEEPYSYQFAAVDGSSPYSWRVASGNLPPGLTLSEGGLISGTPIVSGNFAARIEVKDSASRKDTAEIALTVYPMSLEIVTTSPLRCGMKGYAYLQHLEARGGMPPYTWSHYAGTLPRGLTVSPSGDLSGMLSDTGTFAFTIQLSDSRHATLTKSFSLTIHQALRMTNSLPLKYAMVNRGYDTKLSAEGGTAPYRWNLSGAAISQQITLSEDGGFSGTPSVAGIYSIKISLTDKENFLSESNCTFSIKEELQILAPGEMPVITSGAPIRLKFNARGGALPYRWSWSGQDMLPDLLISAEGELIGNPRRSGTFSFTVQVEDSALYRDSALCVLTINPEVIIPIDSHLPKGMVGERYALTIPHAGGTAPFTWSLSHGSLPDSITLSTEGALNGTPIVPGKYTFTLKISDAAGASTTKEFSLEITPPLKILTAALPEGMVEESYEDTLKAEGGMVPYMWSVKNGTLPEGISLLALGILRGSPVKADVRSFTLEVTDSVKHVVDQSFNFTVKNPCPVLHSLSDTIKSVGDETFTLVVHGAHFVSTSKILFDASPRQTTYMNASLLATQVMSAEMTVEDTLHITVVNDSPGGGVSTIRNLYIKGIAGVQVDRLPGMPRTFVVDQNYPNPFNPTTTIRFGVPSASYVTLTVFDALGRHVASLVSQDLSAGYYSVPFEALGKSSGIYLYRITALPRNGSAAKPFVQAKKLLLLR